MDGMLRIDECGPGADVARVRELFLEYQDAIGVSLAFQGFDEELASLPGAYAPPKGALLIAVQDGVAAGCIALRPLGDGEAEIKRLYVRPAFRGSGLGERLVQAVSERARSAGYRALRLDTLASMGAAMRLYERLGFAETAAYHEAIRPGMRFFRKPLAEPGGG
jgi:ribosomal protein S18 acetylase RimI-like enzyme